MERQELLQVVSKTTEYDLHQIEEIYNSLVGVMTETLSRGEKIVLSPELGIFIPKEWDNTSLQENSPRTRKAARYKIRFREGKELQKKLIRSKDGDEKH